MPVSATATPRPRGVPAVAVTVLLLALSGFGSGGGGGVTLAHAQQGETPLSTTPLQANSAMCASAWNATAPRASVVMRGHPECALAAGCQRSLCTCLGAGFDVGTATCVDAANPSDTLSAPTTCAAVESCTRDAVSCFQQAAVLTSQSPGCEAFSGLLYQHMILAAVGAPAAMHADCLQLRCHVYNHTARLAPSRVSAYAACLVNESNNATCPVPQPATVHLYIRGESWGEVMTEARRPILHAALEHDLAMAVGATARLASLAAQNWTMLHARIVVMVEAAVPFVLSHVRPANGSTAWLGGTHSAYRNSGGVGELSVLASVNAPIDPSVLPTTTVVPPPPPTTAGPGDNSTDAGLPIQGSSTSNVGAGDEGCTAMCQGAIVASVVVVGIVGAGAFAAYRLTRGPADPETMAAAKDSDAVATAAPSKAMPIVVRSRPPSAPLRRPPSSGPTRASSSGEPSSPKPISSGDGSQRSGSEGRQQQQPNSNSRRGSATPPPLYTSAPASAAASSRQQRYEVNATPHGDGAIDV